MIFLIRKITKIQEGLGNDFRFMIYRQQKAELHVGHSHFLLITRTYRLMGFFPTSSSALVCMFDAAPGLERNMSNDLGHSLCVYRCNGWASLWMPVYFFSSSQVGNVHEFLDCVCMFVISMMVVSSTGPPTS